MKNAYKKAKVAIKSTWYWVDQSRLLTEESQIMRRIGLSRPNEFFQKINGNSIWWRATG